MSRPTEDNHAAELSGERAAEPTTNHGKSIDFCYIFEQFIFKFAHRKNFSIITPYNFAHRKKFSHVTILILAHRKNFSHVTETKQKKMKKILKDHIQPDYGSEQERRMKEKINSEETTMVN